MVDVVEYINPDKLHKNPAFTNVIKVTKQNATIYIGGQNAVNEKGEIIGKEDIGLQTEQILKNIDIALMAVGADRTNIIKWSIYIVEGKNTHKGFQAFQKYWGRNPNPPAITTIFVSKLANPDFLVEIEAIAVI